MFNTIKQGVARLTAPAGKDPVRGARARDATLHLRLPSPYGGKPWVSATLAVSSVPRGSGETLRLRAYLESCMHGPQRARAPRTLPAGSAEAPRSWVQRGQRAAAALARRGLAHLPAGRLERLAGRRCRSWLDVTLSTAPLDAGPQALMPEPLRRIYQGGIPRAGPGAPRIGVWAGPAGGPAGGLARLAVLQLDEHDLGRDQAANPLSLNVSLAQLSEPALAGDDESDGLC